MNQTSDNPARDKALADADRESRIMAFLNTMPEDMQPEEMECAIIAIANAYMPDDVLPHFFFYLAMHIKNMDVGATETTTH